MYKKIRCKELKCNNTQRDLDSISFDKIAEKNGWQKISGGYVCPECQMKQISRRKPDKSFNSEKENKVINED